MSIFAPTADIKSSGVRSAGVGGRVGGGDIFAFIAGGLGWIIRIVILCGEGLELGGRFAFDEAEELLVSVENGLGGAKHGLPGVAEMLEIVAAEEE